MHASWMKMNGSGEFPAMRFTEFYKIYPLLIANSTKIR